MSPVVFPTVTLRQPPEIHFGLGCLDRAIAALAESRARRVLLLTSPSVRAAAERCAQVFAAASAAVELLTGIPAEPTTAACERIRDEARRFGPDLVVALGGGSVLDVAKLVAALHDRAEPVAHFYGIGLVTERRTRLACVPTTAGTGSEVSPNALLFDEATQSKKAVIAPALIPDVAIVDPDLTRSLPAALTATTGIDALAHCLEAYTSRAAHPTVDLYAHEGVRLIARHLPRAVADPADREARAGVALGSLYGGLCLGPVNTAGVHALAYPLGGEFHLPHGLSIALLLAEVTRFNAAATPDRHAALARALGALGGVEASDLAPALARLIAACGLTVGLGRQGIPLDALPRLADAAIGVTRLLRNNPRPITRDDILHLYEAAY